MDKPSHKRLLISCLVAAIVVGIIVAVCSNAPESDDVRLAGSDAPAKAPEFADVTWERRLDWYTEELRFDSDGTWTYADVDAGNPVGDSDVFYRYAYDAGTGGVTVLDPGSGRTHEYRVVSHGADSLVMDFGDGMASFRRADG